MPLKLAAGPRNYLAQYIAYSFGTGFLYLYTGTQPVSGGGSHSDTKLASFYLPSSYLESKGTGDWGLAAAYNPTNTSAIAAGTIGWARHINGSNVTDFSVTITSGGGDLEINNVNISNSDSLDITAINITMGET